MANTYYTVSQILEDLHPADTITTVFIIEGEEFQSCSFADFVTLDGKVAEIAIPKDGTREKVRGLLLDAGLDFEGGADDALSGSMRIRVVPAAEPEGDPSGPDMTHGESCGCLRCECCREDW